MKQKLGKYFLFLIVLIFQSLIMTGCTPKVTDKTIDVPMNSKDFEVDNFESIVKEEPYTITKDPENGKVAFIYDTITVPIYLSGYGQIGTTSYDGYRVLYTPETDYTGTDSIKFIVYSYDNTGKKISTTVTININVVEADLTTNNNPIAYDKNITIDYETPTDFNITGSDEDNDTFIFVIDSNTSHGTIDFFDKTTGDITYTPNQGYSGPDHFTFKVVDEFNASSNIADVNITVKGLCDIDPTAPGCPGDPCLVNPTMTPGCPGYDPCLLDPTATGCPLDPCILDPFSQACQDSIANNL